MRSQYTETTKLIPNGSSRRIVSIREILFYTVICASTIIFFILLLLNLLLGKNTFTNSTDVTPIVKQMRRVNLEVDHVSSTFANLTKEDLMGALQECVPKYGKTSYDEDLPVALDWRKKGVIGEVIAQRSCNICWQVSIVQVMESMVAIDRKASHVNPLSIQEFIDCSYRPTCAKGDAQKALEDMTEKRMSIVSEDQYPLTLKRERCRYTHYPKGVMVKDYKVDCNVNETYLKGLINHGPVIATVDPDQWLYYTNGIISENCYSNFPKHVVQIVGYDSTGEIPYYIVKNSWGTDFGDDGYVYIGMGKNLCGIEENIISLDVEY